MPKTNENPTVTEHMTDLVIEMWRRPLYNIHIADVTNQIYLSDLYDMMTMNRKWVRLNMFSGSDVDILISREVNERGHYDLAFCDQSTLVLREVVPLAEFRDDTYKDGQFLFMMTESTTNDFFFTQNLVYGIYHALKLRLRRPQFD